MNKYEFIAELRGRISDLPMQEIEDRLRFYTEMIDDRIEEGMLEDDAVAGIGNVEEIAEQIKKEYPSFEQKASDPEKRPKRRLGTGEIILLILGAPIWLSVIVSVVSAILSLYVALWSVIISLWAVFGGLSAVSLTSVVCGIALAVSAKPVVGLALIGAGFVCAGLSILLFFGCSAISRGTVLITKKTVMAIKNRFAKNKEGQR